jgi:hypothetical protein
MFYCEVNELFMRNLFIILGAMILLLTRVLALSAAEPVRVSEGLAVLYTFDSGSGDTVRDRSQSGTPVDLVIDNPSAVRWGDHSLIVNSKTKLQSRGAASSVAERLKRSGAITIESWITPKDISQKGPARIVSLSAGSSKRNFTLGQEGDPFKFRLRTTTTTTNRIPETHAGKMTAPPQQTHLV